MIGTISSTRKICHIILVMMVFEVLQRLDRIQCILEYCITHDMAFFEVTINLEI